MIDAQHNVATAYFRAAPVSSNLNLPVSEIGRSRALEAALLTQDVPLKRQAQAQGIAPDALDDVVQETFIEAWKHLDQLHTPAHLNAWLQGICRNVCRRWHRSQQTLMGRQTSLSPYLIEKEDEILAVRECELPLPDDFDLSEILCRQDLMTLLDRALGYLPETLRSTVDLYYLAEIPQREAALVLGVTVKAFEIRLLRARRKLRQLLSTELRAEALEFGLNVEPEADKKWRETREWCSYCGLNRLEGYFELGSDGRIRIHFRCAGCERYSIDNSLVHLNGQSSFRPALKRVIQWSGEYLIEGLRSGVQRCPRCGEARPGILSDMDEAVAADPPYPTRPNWTFHCPACDETIIISVGVLPGLHPDARQFILKHPRLVHEPITVANYAGQRTFQFCLQDVASKERLKLFMHPTRWEILGVFQD